MTSNFPVAVTGMGVVCAAGANSDEFLTNLLAANGGIRPIDDEGFAVFDSPVGGMVSDDVLVRGLEKLGIDADTIERSVGFAVIAINEALTQSRIERHAIDPRRVGVVAAKCQVDPARVHSRKGTHQTMGESADAVAKFVDAQGPRIMVSTACAAGTNAIGIGRDKLRTGEADLVIAGGMEALRVPTYAGFNAMRAVAKGPCAPYSQSTGMTLGEGAAFLVLEPLANALARGATVLAEVRGYGLAADAHHITAPEPTGRGAILAMQRALDDAGLDRSDVNYVNGHGTGTPANDSMERNAQRRYFGGLEVPISSTKSFTGHTLGAAGAVEAVASLLAIQHRFLPPTLQAPDTQAGASEVDWDYVPNVPRTETDLDLVLSNNFAFGGNNASIVLAKADRRSAAPEMPRRRSQGVAVTGIGLIGGPGLGVDAWREALARGRAEVRPVIDGAADMRGVGMPSIEGRRWAAPREWRHMSRVARHAVAAARLAVEDAALPMGKDARRDTGLFMGTADGPVEYLQELEGGDPLDVNPLVLPQATISVPAGLVCRVLGLNGPTTTIATGSLSGTLALAAAIDAIDRGDVPACVVVASDEQSEVRFRQAARLGVLSRDDVARPYHPDQPGFLLGEGAVALVVEPIDGAIERGARRYAEIRSVRQGSESLDGMAFDPSRTRWGAVIRDALDAAGVTPAEVQLCVGSASGGMGDLAEADALTSVFDNGLRVATPKAVTGHCMGVSGLVNVAVAALALQSGASPLPTRSLGALLDNGTAGTGPDVDHAVALDVEFGSSYTATVLTKAGPA